MAARRGGWRVYVLRCRDGSLYTGVTNDLDRRLLAHARGRGGRYTRSRLPVVLVHSEPARGRRAALRREAAVKQLSRAEKLELLVAPPAHATGSARPGSAVRRPPRPAPRRAAPRSPSPSRRPRRGT